MIVCGVSQTDFTVQEAPFIPPVTSGISSCCSMDWRWLTIRVLVGERLIKVFN